VPRTAKIDRKTKETRIQATLNLDGTGVAGIETGIPFFDHMLEAFTLHAGFDLTLKADGDLQVDAHHTVEDTGIVLGQAADRALGDRKGIRRYAHFHAPLDEALARVVVDISGRPYLHYDSPIRYETRIGDHYQAGLTREFLRAFATHARLTLHVDLIRAEDPHHGTEAIYKAFARAMKEAVKIDGKQVPSTKGSL